MDATKDTQVVHWTLPRADLDKLRALAQLQDRSITSTARLAIKAYVRDTRDDERDRR